MQFIDHHDEEENDDFDDDDYDDKYDNITMMITMHEECLCEGRHLAVFGSLGISLSHHQTHNLNMAQGRSNVQNYQIFIIKFHWNIHGW